MRVDISIDDELMRQAMQVSGLQNEKAVIEKALRSLISQQTLSPLTVDTQTDPLWQLIGMAEGEAASVARQHDDYLYNKSV
jgi:non-ribosomal peptide synthetase component E (peptide arylation enzyme)